MFQFIRRSGPCRSAELSQQHGRFFAFRYIFVAIENNGTAPGGNGWNIVWNGLCGSRIKASRLMWQWPGGNGVLNGGHTT